MKKILNHSGMSMVQVMIAIGLMGAVSLGLMRMMEQQTKQAKTTKINMELANLKNKLSIIANKRVFCAANFQGRKKGHEIEELLNEEINVNDPNKSIYLSVRDEDDPEKTGEWEHSGLIITRIRILSYAEEVASNYNTYEVNSPPGRGEIRVRFWVKKKGRNQKNGGFYGAEEVTIDINVSVEFGFHASYEMYGTSDKEVEIIKALNKSCTTNAADYELCEGCKEIVGLHPPYHRKEPLPCEEDEEANLFCSSNDENITKIFTGQEANLNIWLYQLQCKVIDNDPNLYIYSCITND